MGNFPSEQLLCKTDLCRASVCPAILAARQRSQFVIFLSILPGRCTRALAVREAGLIWLAIRPVIARRRFGEARMASAGCRYTTCHIVKVPAPTGFDLATAVSSYGFFMLAPNRWVKVRSSGLSVAIESIEHYEITSIIYTWTHLPIWVGSRPSTVLLDIY